jgi:hypothetical protein
MVFLPLTVAVSIFQLADIESSVFPLAIVYEFPIPIIRSTLSVVLIIFPLTFICKNFMLLRRTGGMVLLALAVSSSVFQIADVEKFSIFPFALIVYFSVFFVRLSLAVTLSIFPATFIS